MRTRLFKIAILTVACCGIVAFFGGDTTYAATKTWTGGGDGSTMSDPGNWFGGVAPANGDDLFFATDSIATNYNVMNDIVGLVINSITFDCSYYDYLYVNFYGGNDLRIASAATNNSCNYANFELDAGVNLTGNATFHDINFSSTFLDVGPHTFTVAANSYINTSVIGTGIINAVGAPVSATTSAMVNDIVLDQIDIVQIDDMTGFSGTINISTLFLTIQLPDRPAVMNINPGGSLAINWQPGNIAFTINIYSSDTSLFLICQGSGCPTLLAFDDINLFADTTIGLVMVENPLTVANIIGLSGLNHNGHCLTLEAMDIYELVDGTSSDIVNLDPADFFAGVAINPPCGSVPTVPDVGRVNGDNTMFAFALITTTSSLVVLVGAIVVRRIMVKEGK